MSDPADTVPGKPASLYRSSGFVMNRHYKQPSRGRVPGRTYELEKIMGTLTQMVKNNKKARFVYYRDKALHYTTEEGFIFPVPVNDTGSATLQPEEKAITLMRWIRRHLERCAEEKLRQAQDG